MLQHFTAYDDGKRIRRVAFLVADHPDPEQRTGSINAQIAVDLPISRNGGLLRAEVLGQVRGILDALEEHYERLGQQARQDYVDPHQ